MTKKKSLKRKRENEQVQTEVPEEETQVKLEPTRFSDEAPKKKIKWINRQRVLVFAARGTTQRDRHLMQDLKKMMPHSKDECKMERKENLKIINEMCEMKNCTKCVFFENRKKKDLYMWVSNTPVGPSAKFLVESIFTMGELKLTGNCLKGSRPLLSFDENFSIQPHYALLKELFVQIFGVPNHHPKSQPFIDRVVTFTVMDNRIWYRHYQILKEDGALLEIGPRFVLNPIKIFSGSFCGATLWENPHYITPSVYRRQVAVTASQKYMNRQSQKIHYAATQPKTSYTIPKEDEIFEGDTFDTAEKLAGGKLTQHLKRPGFNPVSLKPRKKHKAPARKKKTTTTDKKTAATNV